ncbi:reverse transcriptase domain-containing protein [Tanacetum coccineum]
MNERCSAVLVNKLPLKEKDPTSFTIPCQVLEKHKEAEDLAADHSSMLENPHMEVLTKKEIANKFSNEHLMALKSKSNNNEPWYADFVNYIVGKVVPPNWTFEKRKRFFSQVKTYFSEEPYAFKLCTDNIMRRCLAGSETLEILAHCHSGPTGGHHSANVTAKKVYKSEFYWPSVFKDVNKYVRQCDACQRSGNISSRNEMPQNNILVEAQALPMNDAREVVKLLRSLFTRFGVPKALISDRGTDFCKSQLEKALQRYGVTHKLSISYHPQSNRKTEVTNRAIKSILERSVGYNLKGDQVLLYNSRLKMYPGKLKSKWSGPNIVKTVYLHGAIEITDRDGFSFKVNGQRLKKYYGGNIEKDDDEVLELENDIDQDSAHMVAASKVPMLKPGEYEIWRIRIEHCIQMIDYALWEVIENGATLPKTTTMEGVVTVMPITTAEEKAQRRLEMKAKSTLMMGIPNEHQLIYKEDSKKSLKQQYENFTAPSSEMLDQTFDRLQKLVSQLELLDENLSQEDVNQKLLRSLSPEWNTHAVV